MLCKFKIIMQIKNCLVTELTHSTYKKYFCGSLTLVSYALYFLNNKSKRIVKDFKHFYTLVKID